MYSITYSIQVNFFSRSNLKKHRINDLITMIYLTSYKIITNLLKTYILWSIVIWMQNMDYCKRINEKNRNVRHMVQQKNAKDKLD